MEGRGLNLVDYSIRGMYIKYQFRCRWVSGGWITAQCNRCYDWIPRSLQRCLMTCNWREGRQKTWSELESSLRSASMYLDGSSLWWRWNPFIKAVVHRGCQRTWSGAAVFDHMTMMMTTSRETDWKHRRQLLLAVLVMLLARNSSCHTTQLAVFTAIHIFRETIQQWSDKRVLHFTR